MLNPDTAQKIGINPGADSDQNKGLGNVHRAAVQREARNVTEQEGPQIEKLGKLEGRKGGSPHIGFGNCGARKGGDTDRRRDVGVLGEPVDDHVGRDLIDPQMGQGRHRHHGGDQVSRRDRHAHAEHQGG